MKNSQRRNGRWRNVIPLPADILLLHAQSQRKTCLIWESSLQALLHTPPPLLPLTHSVVRAPSSWSGNGIASVQDCNELCLSTTSHSGRALPIRTTFEWQKTVKVTVESRTNVTYNQISLSITTIVERVTCFSIALTYNKYTISRHKLGWCPLKMP